MDLAEGPASPFCWSILISTFYIIFFRINKINVSRDKPAGRLVISCRHGQGCPIRGTRAPGGEEEENPLPVPVYYSSSSRAPLLLQKALDVQFVKWPLPVTAAVLRPLAE